MTEKIDNQGNSAHSPTSSPFLLSLTLLTVVVTGCATTTHRASLDPLPNAPFIPAPVVSESDAVTSLRPALLSAPVAESAPGNLALNASLDSIATLPSIASQEGEGAKEEGKDSTGTNPILFTKDFRIYTEFQHFNASGDNGGLVQTFEYRWPIGDDYQFRTRFRGVSRSFDPEGDGSSETTTGVGDFDARLLTVPWTGDGWAIATGLEAFIDSASNDVLGDGATSLGPQIFGVKFNPGMGMTLLAPAYQYVFEIDGDDARTDVDRSLVDIFALWSAKDKSGWVLVDPQFIFDHETNTEFAQLEVEVGQMMFGGLSSYIRPSVGIGADRPVDWSLELGFKVIWR